MIYLDLDNTALDTVGLYNFMVDLLENEFGVPRGVAMQAQQDAHLRHRTYTPEKLCDELAKVGHPVSNDFLIRVYNYIESREMLYPDTMPFLKQFRRQELAILTRGDEFFQRRKIRAHGLDQLVGKLLVTQGEKCDSINDAVMPCTFFLDDAPREIEAMKRRHPWIICIQVREPPPWEEQRTTTYADGYARDLLLAADLIREMRRPIPTP